MALFSINSIQFHRMGNLPRVHSYGSKMAVQLPQRLANAAPHIRPVSKLKLAAASSAVNSPSGAVVVFGEALFGAALLKCRQSRQDERPSSFAPLSVVAPETGMPLRRLPRQSEGSAKRESGILVRSAGKYLVCKRRAAQTASNLASLAQDSLSRWSTCECSRSTRKAGSESCFHYCVRER